MSLLLLYISGTFFSDLGLPGFAEKALAASVKAVSKKKRKVKIDSGTRDGFKKGMTVCVFDDNDKEILCTKITKAKKSYSEIRVKSRKKLKKIKKKYRVDLEEIGSTAGYSYGFRGFWAPTLMAPVVYNKISYKAPTEDSPASLWESAGTSSSSMQAFGFELEMTEYNINVGFRLRTYQPFIAETDFDPNDSSIFAVTEISGSSTGFYVDYLLYQIAGINLLGGLDFDMHSATLITTQKSDSDSTTSEAATITASGTAMSLRTVAAYNLSMGDFGVTAGLNFMIPLVLLGSSVSPSVTTDDTNDGKVEDPNLDLATAFGYGKGSIGMEIILGAYYGL